ncbi:hypothetical protein AbraIFM66951_005936 [Aspergillus brasiliensis]|uniref:Uncharacterized protein n=1 Tax=Aspergillus brasiliensis TaxID=319629 RepID=A0A9W5YNA4_9EURO|nr:hypothetical protein AbraCBS73388_006189 [Aspergillus brasiliensis]GKZ44158.1 hypothetical protein AbraIFM66951_005936 [Aspergillus brasiliensis]
MSSEDSNTAAVASAQDISSFSTCDLAPPHSSAPHAKTDPLALTSSQAAQLPRPSDEWNKVQLHDAGVSIALKALIDNNIPVMEYGVQIAFRWGWKSVLLTVEWAVPDDFLTFASQVLTKNGFLQVAMPKRSNVYLGDWDRLCHIHTRNMEHESPIHLYPLSALHLTLQDTFEVPATFDPDLSILTPKPPRYMLSMIHLLISPPTNQSMRHRVIMDLACFIQGWIFHGPPAEEQEMTVEEMEAGEREFLRKIPMAIEEVRSWDWGDGYDEEYVKVAESIICDPRKMDTLTQLSSV